MAKLNVNVDVAVKGADKLKGLGSSLASTGVEIAKWGAAATGALAGVGYLTAGFASDLNESMSKVDVVFGDNAKQIEDWSKTAAESMGISQQAALESAGTFGNLFTALGIGDKPTTDMSKNLTELASDLASFNNANPEDVLLALRSGLLGEAEPLRKFGVSLSAARIEQKALDLGLADSKKNLTAAAKAQAAYAIILEDTTTAQGDFARTSDGMANQQRILAATFDDTMATVGQAFIPIIQELLPGITEGLKTFGKWIQSNMPTIKAVVSTVFGAIGTAISFVFSEVIPRLVEAFTWVATNVFPGFAAAGSVVSDTVLPAITGAISFIADEVIPRLVEAFTGVFEWVSANWPTISSVIGQALGAIVNVVKTVWPVIESVGSVLFPAIGTAATLLFNALDGTFKLIGGIFEALAGVFRTTGNVIKGIMKGIGTVVGTVWTTVTSIIKGGINFIVDLINGLLGFLNGIRIGIPEIGIPGTDIKIGGGFFDPFNIPLIPKLAEGGIVNSPTLALIGEKGPEAVVPLTGSNAKPEVHIHLTVLGDLAASERTLPGTLRRAAFAAGLTS